MIHAYPLARDRLILCAAAFLRALAAGMCGVALALYLSARGLDAVTLCALISLGLFGGLLATLGAAGAADRVGRRRFLVAIGILTAAGGVGLAEAPSLPWLAAACFLGMVNGHGRERGAGVALDQAMLPQTTGAMGRTRAFAWYNICLDAGHALGALLGGLPKYLRDARGLDTLASYRWTFFVYAALVGAAALLPMLLSRGIEAQGPNAGAPLSPETRRRVTRLSALYGLDSLGGGFLAGSLVSYWFFLRFGADEASLGWLFFWSRLANAASHLGAAWLAGRIGLLNTMVFTHIPSSLVLASVPFAPSFSVAVVLFLVRESLVEMDVPTRQSYLMAIVGPEERARAAGITTLVRNAAAAAGPGLAGPLVTGPALLYAGAGCKVAYDALLYIAFRRVRPPEEGEKKGPS